MHSTKLGLETVAEQYSTEIIAGWVDLYQKKRRYSYERFLKYARPGHALEMGCADGVMTAWITQDFQRTTVLDGSKKFLDETRRKVTAPNVQFEHGYFEDFQTQDRYDTIFMSHILEHLEDPAAVLRRAGSWLTQGGRIIAHVPHAGSLHRLVGVKLGMIAKPQALNEQDVKLGHRRVYTRELLRDHVMDAGLTIVHEGGIMVKPLSNRQIVQQWSEELQDAFLRLGDEHPEISSEIFVVLEK